MNLFLLRHAIAVPRGTAGFRLDAERPLTDEGRKKMRRIARGMKTFGLSFDLILSSPYLRARQTAEIVADTFGLGKRLEFTEHLEPNADPRALIQHLQDHRRAARSVLLTGHEPDLSRLLSILISGEADLPLAIKKGGLGKLTLNGLSYGRCAVLDWLLTPKQLALLRD